MVKPSICAIGALLILSACSSKPAVDSVQPQNDVASNSEDQVGAETSVSAPSPDSAPKIPAITLSCSTSLIKEVFRIVSDPLTGKVYRYNNIDDRNIRYPTIVSDGKIDDNGNIVFLEKYPNKTYSDQYTYVNSNKELDLLNLTTPDAVKKFEDCEAMDDEAKRDCAVAADVSQCIWLRYNRVVGLCNVPDRFSYKCSDIGDHDGELSTAIKSLKGN